MPQPKTTETTASYHARMMNIKATYCSRGDEAPDKRLAYAYGHRDARHAAAEIALEAQAEISDLLSRCERAERERDELQQVYDASKQFAEANAKGLMNAVTMRADERDAALAAKAEVERERDELKAVVGKFIAATGDCGYDCRQGDVCEAVKAGQDLLARDAVGGKDGE